MDERCAKARQVVKERTAAPTLCSCEVRFFLLLFHHTTQE